MNYCIFIDRKKLRHKMATVFGDNIHILSLDLQEMLFDDLVTAFENRVKVLKWVQSDVPIELVKSVDTRRSKLEIH